MKQNALKILAVVALLSFTMTGAWFTKDAGAFGVYLLMVCLAATLPAGYILSTIFPEQS